MGLAVGYVIFFLAVLGLVLWLNKTNKGRAIWGLVIALVFGALPYRLFVYQSPVEKAAVAQQAAEAIEYKAKYDAAKPIFDKLCQEQSAPIIKRTVENVEGVLLLKVRPESKNRNQDLQDPMWAGAALPTEDENDDYIRSFLIDRRLVQNATLDGKALWQVVYELDGGGQRSFRYVVLPAEGGTWTRITASISSDASLAAREKIKLSHASFTGKLPRYSISYVDNLDPDLRKYWIAGTTIKITDTQNNEVIGEQSFWRWDAGFGNTAGFRSPWTTARNACPRFRPGGNDKQTTLFVDEVLKAKQGN